MKKMLALLLAALLLTTVAFAEADMVWGGLNDDGTPWHVYPGAKISVANDIMDKLWDSWDHATKHLRHNDRYFDIKIEFGQGQELIKDMYWQGDDYIVELKDFDALTDDDAEIIVRTLTVKFTRDTKEHYIRLQKSGGDLVFSSGMLNGRALAAGEVTWGISDISVAAVWDVGYDYYELDSHDSGTSESIGGFDGRWKAYINVKDQLASSNTPYYKSTDTKAFRMTFEDRIVGVDDVVLTAQLRLSSGEWFLLTPYEYGRNSYETMEDRYFEVTDGIADAALFGYEGTSLNARATYRLNAPKDYFVYDIDADGNLSESGFRWDENEEVWIKRSMKLGGYYILSAVELNLPAIGDAVSDNPDTGAHETAGIASALTAIALLSAAAVGMRKK